ncbi:MAG: hypothetical protein ACU84Q_14865 [Gammaproteobacteria bacterium]
MNRHINFYLIALSLLTAFISNAHAEGTTIGDKVLDFTVPITSVTYHADKTVINVQTPSAIGEMGIVGGTITLERPVSQTPVAGLYSSQGAAFRPDDKVVTFSGRGSWKALGKHRWQLNGISVNAEGTRTYVSSVLSLDGMSISGTVYSLK